MKKWTKTTRRIKTTQKMLDLTKTGDVARERRQSAPAFVDYKMMQANDDTTAQDDQEELI